MDFIFYILKSRWHLDTFQTLFSVIAQHTKFTWHHSSWEIAATLVVGIL